jgi:hypothetical protein
MLHLTAARPNFVEASKFSANPLTIYFKIDVFYWRTSDLWTQHMVIITYSQITLQEFKLEQMI